MMPLFQFSAPAARQFFDEVCAGALAAHQHTPHQKIGVPQARSHTVLPDIKISYHKGGTM
jgi:hypothetical protein